MNFYDVGASAALESFGVKVAVQRFKPSTYMTGADKIQAVSKEPIRGLSDSAGPKRPNIPLPTVKPKLEGLPTELVRRGIQLPVGPLGAAGILADPTLYGGRGSAGHHAMESLKGNFPYGALHPLPPDSARRAQDMLRGQFVAPHDTNRYWDDEYVRKDLRSPGFVRKLEQDHAL